MTNFKKTIENYSIKIAIIQRDYAQGRNSKQVVEIRSIFLDTIFERLEANELLHMDFFYRSINEKNFFPLDGQKRLTTLFLLYWYFGGKEQKDVKCLDKFTYETRSSSREFCKKLVKSNIDFLENNLTDQICDSSWFLPFRENDPTIKSMFTMIESIHEKFCKKEFFDRLDNLNSSHKCMTD